MKRRFQRREGFLVDTDDEGKPAAHFPASHFGEPLELDAAARDRILEDIANGVPVRGIEGLKSAPNLLEVLLQGLAAGNTSLAHYAAHLFGDDPRVRDGVRNAVVRASLGDLPTLASALETVGGAEDEAILRERMNEALAIRSAFAFASFVNPAAHAIIYIAVALLKLTPDAVDVAELLVRFFEHPCALDRRVAVFKAIEILQGCPTTEVTNRIRAGLQSLVDATDPALFLLAAPLLARSTEGAVLQRCKDLLDDESELVCRDAIYALGEMPPPYAADALAALVRWAPKAAPLRLALQAALKVRSLLPHGTAVNLARRGLASASPGIRLDALFMLDALDQRTRRTLLLDALADEPEPILQRKIEHLLKESQEATTRPAPGPVGVDQPEPRLGFLRQGPLLLDPPEVDTGAIIHASELGEVLSNDDRARLLAQLASEDPAEQQNAITALGPDRAPETLDALLRALDQGGAAASAPLRGFLDDPRVRPALIAALRRAARADLDVLARAVGSSGGHDAVQALRARLPDAAAVFDGEAVMPTADADLGPLVAVAQAIVRLDPDAEDAAGYLLQALNRSTPPSRWLVIDAIVQVSRVDLATVATRTLEHALVPLLEGEDIDAFLAAAPILVRDHSEAVLRRCAAALLDPGSTSVREAMLALARIPFPFAGRALFMLAQWVRRGEGPIGPLLWAAGLVLDLLEPETTVELLRRGLAAPAPSVRLDAIRAIQKLVRTSELLALVATAVAGEPDPLLRREMRQMVEA